MTVFVTANDNDPEGGNLTVTLTTLPAFGTATLYNNNSAIKYVPPSGMANTTVTIGYVVSVLICGGALVTFTKTIAESQSDELHTLYVKVSVPL